MCVCVQQMFPILDGLIRNSAYFPIQCIHDKRLFSICSWQIAIHYEIYSIHSIHCLWNFTLIELIEMKFLAFCSIQSSNFKEFSSTYKHWFVVYTIQSSTTNGLISMFVSIHFDIPTLKNSNWMRSVNYSKDFLINVK